jgi:hypothetical protein
MSQQISGVESSTPCPMLPMVMRSVDRPAFSESIAIAAVLAYLLRPSERPSSDLLVISLPLCVELPKLYI